MGQRGKMVWTVRLFLGLVLSFGAFGSAVAAGKDKSQKAAAQLVADMERLPPGKERDEDVDALVEIGPTAWPEVKAHLDNLMQIKGGEDLVVDLLLGFGMTSFDEAVARAPKLADVPARRLVRQVRDKYPDEPRRLQLLTSMVPRKDDEILLMVLPELIGKNPPLVLARLVELIDDPHPTLRAYAIDTLAAKKFGPALTVMVRLLGIEQLKPSTDNVNLRLKLINAIARLSAGTDVAIDPLISALAVADQREAALDALTIIGAPAVKAAIFMLKTADRARIETALQVLAHLRQQAAPELLPLINAGDERTRELAADILAYIAVPAVRAELLSMVKAKKFVDWKQGILLALALYDEDVRKIMVELLTDKDPAMRQFAVERLWHVDDPETFASLRAVAVKDTELQVRMTAMQADVGVGDPKAMEFLRKMASVTNTVERIAILDTIGRVDDWGGVPVLAAQLGDPSDEVFRMSLSAIRRITYHAGPRRQAEWTAWLEQEAAREPEKIEQFKPDVHRYAADGRELGYLEVDNSADRTIVVVSGPPFRDASHLAPHVYRLAGDHRIIVMKRGVTGQKAATVTEADMTVDLDKLLEKLNVAQVVLLADAPGAHFVLHYAHDHPKQVSHVILHGGPWPTLAAIKRLPGEVFAAIPELWQPDVLWAQRQHALLDATLRQKAMLRGVTAALVANVENGRRVQPANLFGDSFDMDAYDRAVAESAGYEPRHTKTPTLLLLGDKAPWAVSTAADVAKITGAAKKSLSVVTLKNVGATPLLDDPAAATEAILTFLK